MTTLTDKHTGNAFHFFTPFVEFDDIDRGVRHLRGRRRAQSIGLKISHWCDGCQDQGKPLVISKTVDREL